MNPLFRSRTYCCMCWSLSIVMQMLDQYLPRGIKNAGREYVCSSRTTFVLILDCLRRRSRSSDSWFCYRLRQWWVQTKKDSTFVRFDALKSQPTHHTDCKIVRSFLGTHQKISRRYHSSVRKDERIILPRSAHACRYPKPIESYRVQHH